MAAQARLICAAGELQEGGRGVRFTVERYGRQEPAFVVRYDGRARAYLNRCAHVPMQLDWQPGEFFGPQGLYLICTTHGATYDPATGACLGGPCKGRGLVPLSVLEADGQIFLSPP
jgi:nitrite reductase/ring-hydroxylating ferredoxin subunit